MSYWKYNQWQAKQRQLRQEKTAAVTLTFRGYTKPAASLRNKYMTDGADSDEFLESALKSDSYAMPQASGGKWLANAIGSKHKDLISDRVRGVTKFRPLSAEDIDEILKTIEESPGGQSRVTNLRKYLAKLQRDPSVRTILLEY